MSAAFRKVVSGGVLLNPFKLRDLLKAISSSMLTDPDLDMLALARQFQDLSAGNISYATIPNDGTQTIYPDGVVTSIVAVDTAAMPGFINQLQGKPADPGLATAPAAKPSSVTLDVLNGTAIAGLAGRNAAALRKLGFRVETIDSTDQTNTTTVEYPPGAQNQAKAVDEPPSRARSSPRPSRSRRSPSSSAPTAVRRRAWHHTRPLPAPRIRARPRPRQPPRRAWAASTERGLLSASIGILGGHSG